MRYWSLLILALTIPTLMAQQSNAAKALHDLFAAEWDYDMQDSPEFASDLGDRRWNDRWSEETLEHFAKNNQHNQEVLARLAKIDRGSLSAEDQLSYDLFKKNYERGIESYKFHGFLLRLN